jgi:hypothetical protein
LNHFIADCPKKSGGGKNNHQQGASAPQAPQS